MICKFFNIKFNELLNYFETKSSNQENFTIKDSIEYIKPTCFVSDSVIKFEDSIRKKPAYLKYKTIPKWHFHALDLLRYYISFIFTIVKYQTQEKALFFQNSQKTKII